MVNLINKIVLGTAQLDNFYGKNFRDKKLSFQEFRNILNTCHKKKIKYIDTAEKYKNSHSFIGRLNKKRFKIITKLNFNNSKKNIEKTIRFKIDKYLKELKVKKINGILLHDENLLLKKNGSAIFNTLDELKNKKKIDMIGVSFYETHKLIKSLKEYKLDFIQVPYNIFDNRFFSKKIIKIIKKKNIEVHVRSIFLRGFLLSESKLIKKKYPKFFIDHKRFELVCKKRKINYLKFCINYALSNRFVDKIVVGADSLQSIDEIISSVKNYKNLKHTSLKPKNTKILDLRKWK